MIQCNEDLIKLAYKIKNLFHIDIPFSVILCRIDSINFDINYKDNHCFSLKLKDIIHSDINKISKYFGIKINKNNKYFNTSEILIKYIEEIAKITDCSNIFTIINSEILVLLDKNEYPIAISDIKGDNIFYPERDLLEKIGIFN